MQSSLFDRKSLTVEPLAKREHDLDVTAVSPLSDTPPTNKDKRICEVARSIVDARENHSAVILMMGAHVLRSGVQNYLIDLMERGYISCVAANGAGMIHDYEFAFIGATTESVSHYIRDGQFGLWKETARLNDIINEVYSKDKTVGMGQAVGAFLEKSNFPYKSISILAAGYRLGVPVTIHVGIGYDIIHEHPNCDGAATGALSYNDFLKFASVVQNLENGVVMNFGSAVMAPEVFLKALSMARNIAHGQNKTISHFTSLVCDLVELPDDVSAEPAKDNPRYYFRPWKTMLVRTVADGGRGFYVKGGHGQTIPALWSAINELELKIGKSPRHKSAGGKPAKVKV
jgi:hypothetical protein